MNKVGKLSIIEAGVVVSFGISLAISLYLLRLTAWFVPQSYLLATVATCRQFFVSSSQSLIGSGVILFGLFFISLALSLLTVIGSILKLRIQFSYLESSSKRIPTRVRRLVDKFNLKPTQVIYLNSAEVIASSVGLVRPKIVLSKGLLDRLKPDELEAVMCHEVNHLNHRHGLILFLFSLTQKLFWMSPIFEVFKTQLKYRFEIQADQAVLNYFKTDNVLTRTRMALQTINHTRFEYGLNFSQSLNQRQPQKLKRQQLILKSLLSLVGGSLIVWCLINLNQPLEISAFEANTSGGSCISSSSLDTVCRQNLSLPNKSCEWRNHSSLY